MKPPVATYRVQLNRDFGFAQLKNILPYLSKLGISHIYASPIFQARQGSMHGYDIVDPNRISDALGGARTFEALNREVAACGLEWVQDIVPNHIAYTPQTLWVADVMKKGADSVYYRFLDVDWNHPSKTLHGKVMSPFLERNIQQCLKRGDLQIVYDDGFAIKYKETQYPLSVNSYRKVLGAKFDAALFSCPSNLEQTTQIAINKALKEYNQDPSKLKELLSTQVFALTDWRRALKQINYRRFFNITDLICLRMEEPGLFETVHYLAMDMVRKGKIAGIRVDHIDGLHDPEAYLQTLSKNIPSAYVVVEKILADNEELPESWQVHGSTGYDFLSQLNGLFVNTENEDAFSRLYSEFAGEATDFSKLLCDCKRRVIEESFRGDIDNLARLTETILQKRQPGINMDRACLRAAVTELCVAFSVYRTYLSEKNRGTPASEPFRQALTTAKQRNPHLSTELVVLEDLLNECVTSQEALAVFTRLQQFTGAVMAKGLEDTAFYVYNRLISLNEVGSNPSRFGTSTDEFHAFNQARLEKWPLTLNATSTHDTKRGEDVRARLNVLSEVPEEFQHCLELWAELNAKKRQRIRGKLAPNRNEEYYLYQTLLGAFPFNREELPFFASRVQTHIVKAVREAKINSNWLSPRQQYEKAVATFIRELLDVEKNNAFMADFLSFQKKTAFYGVFNSLAQTLLKITSPGVPDFYQGSELWDLNLVDPDNRRPVDFPQRQRMLAEISKIETPKALSLLEKHEDARVKLYVIWKALQARKGKRSLFAEGTYIPLRVEGSLSKHVVAFCRQKATTYALTIVPRSLTRLVNAELGYGSVDWMDTRVCLPQDAPSSWTNVFTGETCRSNTESGKEGLALNEVLSKFPVALLLSGEKA